MPTPSRPASPAKPTRPQPTDSKLTAPSASPRLASNSAGATANTATSASERAAQALEAMRLKARAIATPTPAPPLAEARTPVPRRRVAPRRPTESRLETAENTRRRSGVETRAQLIERLNNPLLTLQETALILRVCPATVRRYSNSGLLPHVRTEGNQRRFRWRDVQLLVREMEARRK